MIANFDAFERLGLPHELVLDEERIKAHYHERSAIEHPDQQGDEDSDFARLVQAKAILSSPAKRLQHWLELKLGDQAPDRRGTVSSDLMNLFGEVASCIASADEVIAKREKAQSALALALTENAASVAREAIETQQAAVGMMIKGEVAHFDELQREELSAQIETAARCARNLAFLEKWQAQLKERFARLF